MRRTLTLTVLALVLLLPAVAGADDGTFASYQDRGWGWMFMASFGFGFLTSLTPCVYPMIPITLAIFGARGDKVSKGRAIALATAYVFGMGATYSVLGVTFALIGSAGDFGTQLANPWIVFPLVILFLALAASMFGAFDLNLCRLRIAQPQEQGREHQARLSIGGTLFQRIAQIDCGRTEVALRHLGPGALDMRLRGHEQVASGQSQETAERTNRHKMLE